MLFAKSKLGKLCTIQKTNGYN